MDNKIPSMSDLSGKWKSLTGALCFNIWHSTKHDFLESNDYSDMTFPFLCSLYVFHNWDNSILSKKFSITELLPEVYPKVIEFKDALIKDALEMKHELAEVYAKRERESQMKIEPSKAFVGIFIISLLNSSLDWLKKDNPLDFFQFGLEVLLLFTLEIKEKDRDFYDLIEDIGDLEKRDAKEILQQINLVFE